MIDFAGIAEKTGKAYTEGARLIAHKGGTRSGKTYGVLTFLVLLALAGRVKAIDCVSESYPHLNRGIIKDLREILQGTGINYTENKSDHSFLINRCEIRCFAADDWGKVKGSRREVLFINEANRVEYEIYRQLAVRTTKCIIIDFNPDAEFWYELKHINTAEGTTEYHSTYKDNPYLSAEQIAEIESNKDDIRWWRVYGEGQTGGREGLCLTNWQQVPELPNTYKRWLGLDFGFANDPTAIVDVRLNDGQLWVGELLYRKGLTNFDVADFLKKNDLQNAEIVADSAELKSIEELKRLGIRNIEPAEKGGGSIQTGLDVLNRYKINILNTSENLIYEARNYHYKEDKNGQILNTPIDKYNHAIDALRYVALNKIYTKPQRIQKTSITELW